VQDAEGLTTEQMARFSAWTNLSECAFVLAPSDPAADYRVRIFSLTTELPFAGHPTLGTARAWLDAGGVPRTPGRVVQECGVGMVPVRIDDDALAFADPPLVRSGQVDDADLAVALSVVGVDADAVLAVEPDLASRVGQWSIGVVGQYGPGSDAALEVRAFFNDSGGPLREDPVTGSLNASIAQRLTATGRVEAPYTARQGARMGRDGRVHVAHIEGESWIGGWAVVTASGVVDL
jgi:predicted PhzF superfamily epimerase YddE/YHI9